MPLSNGKINLFSIWSDDCVISFVTEATKFKIADTKLYDLAVNLLTEDNSKTFTTIKIRF